MRVEAQLIVTLFTSFSISYQQGRDEPLPICRECVPREDILAPGIGFDLSTSYATAAVRYYNGSVQNLVKVESGSAFQELVGRLFKYTERPFCSSVDFKRKTPWEKAKCQAIRLKRRLNKMRGIPATTDVGVIADVITRLCTAVQDILGQGPENCGRAVVVLPPLIGLAPEDTYDAMDFSSLSRPQHDRYNGWLTEFGAAYAGMGFGLCQNYTDLYYCEGEEENMEFRNVLALTFNNASFSAAYDWMMEVGTYLPSEQDIRFDLGFGSLPEIESEQARFWKEIKRVIVDVGKESQRLGFGPINTLLLMGEYAKTSKFESAVKDALQELLSGPFAGDLMTIREATEQVFDPTWIAARGAAEMAKRAQEAPFGCVEKKHCADNRRPPQEIGDGVFESQIALQMELK